MEAIPFLRNFLATHRLDQLLATGMVTDINLCLDLYTTIGEQEHERRLQLSRRLKAYYYVFDTNSPYAEVRASVSNTDDPSIPVDTFRAWFLGLSFVCVFSALNQVLTFLWICLYIADIVVLVPLVALANYTPWSRLCSSHEFSLWKTFRKIAVKKIPSLWSHLVLQSRPVQSKGAYAHHCYGKRGIDWDIFDLDFPGTDLANVLQTRLGSK
jgi:hypothetical protein